MTTKIFLFAILSSGFIISAAQTNTTASTEEITSGSETQEIQIKQFIENFKDAVNSTLKEDISAIKNSTKSMQDIIADGRELKTSGPRFFYRMMSGNQDSKK